jgi:hypothetical protein
LRPSAFLCLLTRICVLQRHLIDTILPRRTICQMMRHPDIRRVKPRVEVALPGTANHAIDGMEVS